MVHELLAHVKVALASRNMQARESVAILECRVARTIVRGKEQIDRLEQVELDGAMQRTVLSDLGVLLRIRISTIVQQRLNHGVVLILDGSMERSRAVDVAAIHVGLAVIKQRNHIMNVVMIHGVYQYVSANILYSRLHYFNGN